MIIDHEIEALCVWDQLLSALYRLECYRIVKDRGRIWLYEPQCRALYFDADYALVAAVVANTEFPPQRGIEFFSKCWVRQRLEYELHRSVTPMALDDAICFRVLLEDTPEKIAA